MFAKTILIIIENFKSIEKPKKTIVHNSLKNVHIMNVNYAKFQKTFHSRTMSRELP